jgi:hypothetical protein
MLSVEVAFPISILLSTTRKKHTVQVCKIGYCIGEVRDDLSRLEIAESLG